jgi:hypothetical protein
MNYLFSKLAMLTLILVMCTASAFAAIDAGPTCQETRSGLGFLKYRIRTHKERALKSRSPKALEQEMRLVEQLEHDLEIARAYAREIHCDLQE